MKVVMLSAIVALVLIGTASSRPQFLGGHRRPPGHFAPGAAVPVPPAPGAIQGIGGAGGNAAALLGNGQRKRDLEIN